MVEVERRSTILKGVLDVCLLALVDQEVVYGYELARRLGDRGLPVAGGSTYPLLARLERNGWVSGETRASDVGPARKYYSLTEAGSRALDEGRRDWSAVAAAVTSILDSPPSRTATSSKEH